MLPCLVYLLRWGLVFLWADLKLQMSDIHLPNNWDCRFDPLYLSYKYTLVCVSKQKRIRSQWISNLGPESYLQLTPPIDLPMLLLQNFANLTFNNCFLKLFFHAVTVKASPVIDDWISNVLSNTILKYCTAYNEAQYFL
jgi:hypothetical protein